MASVVELLHAPLLGIFPAVESETALGINLLRLVGKPEVHQIEVMGGLVHEQPAAVVLRAVPAPVIIGSVSGVEKPLEVHLERSPDDTVPYKLSHLRVVGSISVVERNPDVTSGPLCRIDYALRPPLIGRDRLLGYDVAPLLHGPDDVVVMGPVH